MQADYTNSNNDRNEMKMARSAVSRARAVACFQKIYIYIFRLLPKYLSRYITFRSFNFVSGVSFLSRCGKWVGYLPNTPSR